MRLRLAAALLAAHLPNAHAAPSATGLWLTEDRGGIVEIAPCGAGLCGRIVGMAAAAAPNEAPRCGLTILPDATLGPDGRYSGHITDPSTGSVWQCSLWLDDADTLHLRGYVLLPWLGQTQRWTRYTGRVTDRCDMTS